MTKLASQLGALVAAAGPYVAVSLHMGKALHHNHAFSTQRFPYDQGDGQFSRGAVSCQDSIFSASKARADHPTPGTGIADGEKILMGEWGTGQRLRAIDFKKTVAFAAPAEQTAAEYFANATDGLFSGNTTAAFPAFTLWAEDPEDADFEPILLISEAETTGAGNVEGSVRPLSALVYGVNRRKRPLMIVARAEGEVPDNSGLFLHMTLTEQHK